MKVKDYIRGLFARALNVLYDGNLGGFFGAMGISKYPFARLVFANICSILTDLDNDVEFVRKSGDMMLFARFKQFFSQYAILIHTRLFEVGYVVIGLRGSDMWLMRSSEYTTTSDAEGDIKVRAYRADVQVYVMRSQTFAIYGLSDRTMCKPAMDMLDNVLNASNTIAKRLGAMVIATPATPSSAPIAGVLNKKAKEDLEKEISDKYGALDRQSQIMVLPNDMKFSTINLAGLDIKLQEKVRTAVLMIADRIGVPANQISLIDANSNKTLSNGSELREGDFNKYQAYERMLNETFVQMAQDIGLKVDYTIYNKPIRQIGG